MLPKLLPQNSRSFKVNYLKVKLLFYIIITYIQLNLSLLFNQFLLCLKK